MPQIRVGVVGAGYMGKAHSVALNAVGAVFDTPLRPVCEMLCTTTEAGAAEKARAFGFARSTANWQELVDDPAVEAVIIASPQTTHRSIAEAALGRGKPVFCEKPLGESLADSLAMVSAAKAAGVANMVGFNYIRTPASRLALEIVESGEIGAITHIRAEHVEDFFADPETPANWRSRTLAAGTMGDLAPHIINCVLRLVGPIDELCADIRTFHTQRSGPAGIEDVANDDYAQFLCRFANGASGSITSSRVATGRKMGYAYELFGTKGSLRFDQEDQNALWLYRMDTLPARAGFTKILTGPDHPDYVNFCQGPGHGTGYQDQIIIEMRDFLCAISSKRPVWPTFADGAEVNRVVEAARQSQESRGWVRPSDI